MSRDPSTVDVVVSYHAGEKVPLLHHAVLPMANHAAAAGLPVHVERHWLRGPHVRIRLDGRADVVTRTAGAMVSGLGRHLAAHPSRSAVDPATLLAGASERGRAELVPGPYGPIRPDNTVLVEAPDDAWLYRLLGSAEAVACRTHLLRAGLAPLTASVAHLVRHGNTAQERVWLALDAMTVHAARYPAGIAGGYQSFLSHLEDFLHLNDPDARVRTVFEREWSRVGEHVTERVARLAGIDPPPLRPGPPEPVISAWRDWEQDAWRICRAAHDRGELGLPGPGYRESAATLGDEATSDRWGSRQHTGYSDYHQRLLEVDFLALPGVGEHFLPYRFATNVFYLLLAVCDVTPLERYLAAYLLSQAVPRLIGITWQEAFEANTTGSEVTR